MKELQTDKPKHISPTHHVHSVEIPLLVFQGTCDEFLITRHGGISGKRWRKQETYASCITFKD